MTDTLRVVIDATSMPEDLGGVGRYLQHLVPALARLPQLDVVVLSQDRNADWFRTAAPQADVRTPLRGSGRLRRLAWEQFGLARLARRLGADVIHAPHYTMPVFCRTPVVVTIHDATFFSHPELHTRLKRMFFRGWTRWSLRHARGIVVPSTATASELARYVSGSTALVTVAHHGVDPERFHVPTSEEVKRVAERCALPDGRWISFLGTVEPRKNVAGLVRGYAAATRNGDLPPLVIAGAAGWDVETSDVVAGLPPDVDVRLVGYLDAELLPGFLGGAELFVYPSLGEGFGLPILEAMACGSAVLTTNLLALPEVGGDAVAYTEPDSSSIAEAIGRLIADPQERAELGARGRARAASFTWGASAEAHAGAYSLAGVTT